MSSIHPHAWKHQQLSCITIQLMVFFSTGLWSKAWCLHKTVCTPKKNRFLKFLHDVSILLILFSWVFVLASSLLYHYQWIQCQWMFTHKCTYVHLFSSSSLVNYHRSKVSGHFFCRSCSSSLFLRPFNACTTFGFSLCCKSFPCNEVDLSILRSSSSCQDISKVKRIRKPNLVLLL